MNSVLEHMTPRQNLPVIYLFVVLSLSLLLGCATGGFATPSKPTVQILAPAFGAAFAEGQSVSVQSISFDPARITRVELLIDGQVVTESRPPNAQGETQFTVIQQWQATGVGAHTLAVRAFNTANASGETSLPIAISGNIADLPSPTPSDSPLATATSAVIPSATPLTPDAATPIVAATPVVANTPTSAPTTPPPPTPLPPTPIPPTVPPLAFLPPFDGGMSVFVDWNGEDMQIEAEANDTVVGNDNGDGIAYIDFFIQDLNGNVIATKRENNRPYCFFGEADGQCVFSKPGDPNFRWSASREITDGWYFIRAVAHTPDNRIQVAEEALLVELGGDGVPDLFVNVIEPDAFNIDRVLDVEATVEGNAAASGIQRVDFTIVDYDGNVVHTRTEQSPRYCGFSGGEGTFPCNRYNFAQNGGKWSNGTLVVPSQYVIRAIAYANNGAIAADTFFFQIDRVQ